MGNVLVVYLLILVAKIVEVTLATTRIVLITKGEKLLGSIIGFFEIIIWVIIISTVLKDITSDPIKVVVYALGFAIGNYLGSVVEEKLSFGTLRLEAIVKEKDGDELVESLRKNGFAVTVVKGKGMNSDRYVLIMNIKRRKLSEATQLIKEIQSNVVITINDIKPVYGGYGLIKK